MKVFSVVGLPFRNVNPNDIDASKLSILFEPDNAYDRNAIKILHGDDHIGYIDRENAADVDLRRYVI